jgi:RND superfamily putative drug exporter
MLTVGVGVLSGAAIGASIAVLFPMLAAQTLLPALVGILGKRTLTRRQRAALGRGETGIPETSARWLAWAGRVQAHRIVFALGALGALGVLVALGVPFFSMRQGTADYSTDPTSTTTTTYRGYEMLVQGFGPGFSGPLQLVATVNGPADEAEFARVVSAAAHTSGVVTTAGPEVLPAGPGHPAIAVAEVYPAGSPQDASTSALITRLRDSVIPATVHGSNLDVLVGGQTALADDFASQLSTKLPLFVGMVVALSFLLLMIVFRSIAIPATAAIMNLFSAAAAFGVIVAVFQWGWLAAAIMIVVFASFVITTDRTVKMIGLGMAAAILIDALLIRTVLVPAIMHSIGKANWSLPAAPDRYLPRLNLEAGEQADEQADETPPGRSLDPAPVP